MSEVHAFLEKAARSLDAARVLLANGDADFAASRAYYGCFYVAESLVYSTVRFVLGNPPTMARILTWTMPKSTK